MKKWRIMWNANAMLDTLPSWTFMFGMSSVPGRATKEKEWMNKKTIQHYLNTGVCACVCGCMYAACAPYILRVCVYLLLFYLYVHLTLSNVEYGNTYSPSETENIHTRGASEREREKLYNKNKLCPIFRICSLYFFIFQIILNLSCAYAVYCSFPFPFCLNGTHIFFVNDLNFRFLSTLCIHWHQKMVVVVNIWAISSLLLPRIHIHHRTQAHSATHTQHISWALLNTLFGIARSTTTLYTYFQITPFNIFESKSKKKRY